MLVTARTSTTGRKSNMLFNTNKWNRIRYTLYVPFYDLIVWALNRYRRESIELLNIKQNEKVLIVGAGTGLDLNYIPRHAHVTATDITPGMINKLLSRARRLGLEVNASVMDGQDLEFEDSTFDCIVLNLIVAVIPEPNKCIREAERVMKSAPQGRAVVFDKFVKTGEKPSAMRKLLNLITGTFFSDINRKFEDIISGTGLRIVSDKPAAMGGAFRIILLEKADRLST